MFLFIKLNVTQLHSLLQRKIPPHKDTPHTLCYAKYLVTKCRDVQCFTHCTVTYTGTDKQMAGYDSMKILKNT
jgi:hypothetical protein